jgi:hypothetical protein
VAEEAETELPDDAPFAGSDLSLAAALDEVAKDPDLHPRLDALFEALKLSPNWREMRAARDAAAKGASHG